MYGVDSIGLDGELKKFEKPIFQTWLMFFAMIFALPIQWAYHWHVERKWRKNNRGGCTLLSSFSMSSGYFLFSLKMCVTGLNPPF